MFLHALGHFHPSNVIDNAFLESLDIGTSDEWITERVGIRRRHTVLPLDYIRETKNRDPRAALEAAELSNAETGARAAQLALDRAGLKASDIGMVVAGGCSPDECIPAEACRIAELMGIEAPSMDLNSACSSFCAQLWWLEGMRPERLPDFVLMVNPENSTRVVDYTDRTSCVLWGDGTSAAIVSPRIPGPWRVSQTLLRGDPSGADKVKVPRVGHFTQQGRGSADLRDQARRRDVHGAASGLARERPRADAGRADLHRPPGEPAHARVGAASLRGLRRAPLLQRGGPRQLRRFRGAHRDVRALG